MQWCPKILYEQYLGHSFTTRVVRDGDYVRTGPGSERGRKWQFCCGFYHIDHISHLKAHTRTHTHTHTHKYEYDYPNISVNKRKSNNFYLNSDIKNRVYQVLIQTKQNQETKVDNLTEWTKYAKHKCEQEYIQLQWIKAIKDDEKTRSHDRN